MKQRMIGNCICGNKTEFCWDNGDCKKRESSFGNSAFECEPISPSYGYWDEDGSRVKE